MVSRVLKTGNENQRSFELKSPISVREKTYASSSQAVASPVASKIFGFPWAESVTVAPRSVTVSKQDWVSWDVLEEPLKDLLIEHFKGSQGVEENPEPGKREDFGGVIEKTDSVAPPMAKADSLNSARIIKSLIENEINPALAAHGGFVNLHSVEGDKVFIEMGGGCQGCAMSYMTLKEGIEEAIREAVPGIKTVIDVTDHTEGENPYF